MKKALAVAILACFVMSAIPAFAQEAAPAKSAAVEKKSTKTNIIAELAQAIRNLGVCSSKKK